MGDIFSSHLLGHVSTVSEGMSTLGAGGVLLSLRRAGYVNLQLTSLQRLKWEHSKVRHGTFNAQ